MLDFPHWNAIQDFAVLLSPLRLGNISVLIYSHDTVWESETGSGIKINRNRQEYPLACSKLCAVHCGWIEQWFSKWRPGTPWVSAVQCQGVHEGLFQCNIQKCCSNLANNAPTFNHKKKSVPCWFHFTLKTTTWYNNYLNNWGGPGEARHIFSGSPAQRSLGASGVEPGMWKLCTVLYFSWAGSTDLHTPPGCFFGQEQRRGLLTCSSKVRVSRRETCWIMEMEVDDLFIGNTEI